MSVDRRTYYVRLGVTVASIACLLVLVKILFFQDGTSETTGGQTNGANVISWQDAADYYGETCTVEGTIVLAHNSGKACFLNFHPNWKKYFTAVIFRSAFSRFPDNPEDHYRGKKVRVTGYIKEYKGKPEIILESPEQIEIID